LALYVVVGALGVPVFADGAGGPGHLFGPTLGYLAGFVVGAALMGWWVRRPSAGEGWRRVVLTAFAGAVLAHGVVLLLGWLRLGALVGPAEAFAGGVRPFLVGAVAKSAAAALIWPVIRSRTEPVARPLVG
jgi:biotin transport system substrate-specific component